MAMNDDPRLGCGRLADDVWATADDPPSPHEETCPFCQRARASLQALADATDDLVAYEADDPDYRPGAFVKDLVMQLVHVEVRRGRPIALLTPDDPAETPSLAITEQAVLDVIWRAADLLLGLRARHCAVHLDPADQSPGRPASVQIEVQIAVAAGLPIPEAVDRMRAQLREMIEVETGLATRRITVTVEDLYDA